VVSRHGAAVDVTTQASGLAIDPPRTAGIGFLGGPDGLCENLFVTGERRRARV